MIEAAVIFLIKSFVFSFIFFAVGFSFLKMLFRDIKVSMNKFTRGKREE
jgi:hypothetical protein